VYFVTFVVKIGLLEDRMSNAYRIGVIPGDGTGPEVVEQGLKALAAAAECNGFSYELITYDVGGERYLRTGETLPSSVLEELRKVQAIYLGAIGHPEVPPGVLEQGILLTIRFSLDQYINLRPVVLYPGVWTPLRDKRPEDINCVVVRENTEGLYVGSGGFLRKGSSEEVAVQESINTRKGVERCIRYAFELCRRRQRRKVTLCGKTNVLTYAFDLWERTFHEVAEEYKDVEADYAHVDALCMWMVKNPEWFDVIVTDNMFGDIITDLGAMIQGGMGIAAGGNINPDGVSMFEPIGGSAPKYTGKNMINPLAAVVALSMLLDNLGEENASRQVEDAVKRVVKGDLQSMDAGRMGLTTQEVGDMVAGYILDG
jgi:3-isopropylmalate dehydrogenase